MPPNAMPQFSSIVCSSRDFSRSDRSGIELPLITYS